MTDNEIIRSYREAKGKDKQIGILADLTARKGEEITAILRKGGALDPINGDVREKWTPERNAELLELRKQGLTWDEIAARMGGTNKSVSMHYYSLTKPKHIQSAQAQPDEAVKDTPCPTNDKPQKTAAFGFDNIIAVLTAGEFDTVTFENADVSVTVRRKAV